MRPPDYTYVETLLPDIKWSYSIWVDDEKATFVASIFEKGEWWVKFRKEMKKR